MVEHGQHPAMYLVTAVTLVATIAALGVARHLPPLRGAAGEVHLYSLR
jgi:hypothetical protein